MSLQYARTPEWRDDLLNVMLAEGWAAFDLDVSPADEQRIRASIAAGRPLPRRNPPDETYDILVNGQFAGDIGFMRSAQDEINIIVLPGFRRCGVASRALAAFLQQVTVRPLQAKVRLKNRLRVFVIQLVTRAGFCPRSSASHNEWFDLP